MNVGWSIQSENKSANNENKNDAEPSSAHHVLPFSWDEATPLRIPAERSPALLGFSKNGLWVWNLDPNLELGIQAPRLFTVNYG